MKTFSLITFCLTFSALNAQQLDTRTLNANSVNASISEGAVFFFNATQSSAAYEVPAGSGKSTIFASSIWIGGEDINGQAHVSASRFSTSGWSPGPIADNQYYTSLGYSNAYSTSIWKVTRQQVIDHQAQYSQGGYTPIPEIADWPGNGDVSMGIADQLAPFVDLDGDGVYEPMDGDHPDFPGDEVVYVIANDAANPDSSFLGAEMHLMFYQFNTNGYLGETTFLNSRVFNRSTTNYYNFRQSIYTDFDIGNYQDDYVGCDSVRNMMYAYNGDVLDETNGGALGYGQNPPCQAVLSLNREMVGSAYYTNGGIYPTSDPNYDPEFWNVMNGYWVDGTPVLYGGNGYNQGTTTTPTSFVFTGNPYTGTGWTELNANNGGPNPPEDRRAVMTVIHDDLSAGTMVCSDFAFIYDDDDGHLENVQNVMYIADALQTLYDGSSDFPCPNFTAFTPEETSVAFAMYPNPSQGDFTIDVANTSNAVIMEIRDMSGRLIQTEILEAPSTHVHVDIPPGVYQVSVQSTLSRTVKSIVIQ